eukprot:GHVN01029942.1.p1 GENE.GHVN01029942.1~~GHVN01029942.1.p1  ORF type:complete len:526 (+),score=120.85 GHVN01029942.1:349-1926(+)
MYLTHIKSCAPQRLLSITSFASQANLASINPPTLLSSAQSFSSLTLPSSLTKLDSNRLRAPIFTFVQHDQKRAARGGKNRYEMGEASEVGQKAKVSRESEVSEDGGKVVSAALGVKEDFPPFWKSYWHLSKGRLSLWVALSTVPAYLAVCSSITPLTLASVFTGTLASSASAAAFNQVIEHKLDKNMGRTSQRPVARGVISVRHGLGFALVSGVCGVGVLSVGCNSLTAALAAINIGSYALIYTPMKRVSPYNTHVGSIVGSVPVLMGATAATASLAGHPLPPVLFMIQTLWQFPHFYSLAWIHRRDYQRVGFKMFPLSDVTGHKTAAMIQPYVLATAALPAVSCIFDLTTWMLLVDSAAPNAFLVYKFFQFKNNPSTKTAQAFFATSLWHLMVLMSLCAFHVRPQADTATQPYPSASTHSLSHKVEGFNCPTDRNSPVTSHIRERLFWYCPHSHCLLLYRFCPMATAHTAVSRIQDNTESAKLNSYQVPIDALTSLASLTTTSLTSLSRAPQLAGTVTGDETVE